MFSSDADSRRTLNCDRLTNSFRELRLAELMTLLHIRKPELRGTEGTSHMLAVGFIFLSKTRSNKAQRERDSATLFLPRALARHHTTHSHTRDAGRMSVTGERHPSVTVLPCLLQANSCKATLTANDVQDSVSQ